MAKLILWDFDGPIFDGRTPRNTAFEKLLDEYPEARDLDFDICSTPLYDPRRTIRLAFSSFDWSREKETEIEETFRQLLRAEEQASGIQPGVENVLEAIRRLDCTQAIISLRSDASLRALLDRLEIDGYFSEVVSRDNGFAPKPSPDGIHHVLRKTGVEVAQAVLIGDSGVDFQAAKSAGIVYFHAGWSSEPAFPSEGARPWVASSPAEIELVVRDGFHAVPNTEDAQKLRDHVTTGSFSFFAGAGISIPSGIGGWNDTYAPILTKYLPQSILDGFQMPEAVQLICSDEENGSGLFDDFQSFFKTKRNPNSYHYTMVRSKCETIWTTNYDDLFEQAKSLCGVPEHLFRSDADLRDNFGSGRAIIKVNGDFVGATFDKKNVEWGVAVSDEQFDTAEAQRQEIWRMFEDEFRTSCLVFVGVSFLDPTLKRILSIISRKLMRPRNPHYVLSIHPQTVEERLVVRRQVVNLRRRGIRTLFFDKFDDISRFVSELCMASRMPVIGFSGSAYVPENNDAQLMLSSGSLTFSEVERLCHAAGRSLATRGYRVLSGHGPNVGVPAVAAAYDKDKRAGRFYMRLKGRTPGTRSAPVVIVSHDDISEARRALVESCCVLIAMGGAGGRGREGGTVTEVLMAIERNRPVVLVPQAGGDIAECREELMNRLEQALVDPKIKSSVLELNDEISKMSNKDLSRFFKGDLAIRITNITELLAASSISDVFEAACANADEKWWT